MPHPALSSPRPFVCRSAMVLFNPLIADAGGHYLNM